MTAIEQLIERAFQHNASDIHLCESSLPRVRIQGAITTWKINISSAEISEFIKAYDLTPDWITTIQYKDSRLRVTLSNSYAGRSLAIRLIHANKLTLEELHLPSVLHNVTSFSQGLFLIAGATGSGKSTTASALITQILAVKPIHLLTIEDPIETIYMSHDSLITQQELGTHFTSFADAAIKSLHQDPDVIYFSELTDYETIQTALTLAETGHLVIGTVHARGAVDVVSRIVDTFETSRQGFVKNQLLSVLKSVCWQQLIPVADTRYPLVEYLQMDPALNAFYLQNKPSHVIRCELDSHRDCISRVESALTLLSAGADLKSLSQFLTADEKTEINIRRGVSSRG